MLWVCYLSSVHRPRRAESKAAAILLLFNGIRWLARTDGQRAAGIG